MVERVEMPRHVGGPPQLFFWELDEVIIFTFCMMIGILMRELFWTMLGGIVVTRLFSNWKMGQLRGVLAHMAYWHGFAALNPAFRNGDVRNFIE